MNASVTFLDEAVRHACGCGAGDDNEPPVLFTRLDRAGMNDFGQTVQVHAVVNFDGLNIIWKGRRVAGEFVTDEQYFELQNGQRIDDLGEALDAWDLMHRDLASTEAVGEALYRAVNGLTQPMWYELSDDDKSHWLAHARHCKGIIQTLGFQLVPVGRAS